jgi:integrase
MLPRLLLRLSRSEGVYVAPRSSGEAPPEAADGNGSHHRLKRRSGVLRVRSHLLRHHFAQVALEKGAERAAVQEMLGHRTEAMTRRYTASVRQLSAAKLMPKYAPL